MLKNLNRRILLLALLLGLVASYLVYSYLNSMEETVVVAQDLRPVVVASRDVPMHTRVTREMVQMAQVPAEYILPSSFTSLDDVVGGISKVDLIRGEQVAKSRVYHGELDAAFAYLVPEGMRGVAVAVSEVSAVGNLIRAGDRVDVLVTYNRSEGTRQEVSTLSLLQNVQILAVGQVTDPSVAVASDGFRTVTLALAPNHTQLVTLAEQVGGLKLALRSPLDEIKVPLEPVTERSLSPQG